MSDYTVDIVRADADDRAWSVDVRERPDWRFREKNFSSIADRVRAIAHERGEEGSLNAKVIYGEVRVGDVDITDALLRLDHLRLQVHVLAGMIDTTTDELIALLRQKAGLTTRDTASIVGLSHARVHQRERADRVPPHNQGTNLGVTDK